jgi:hypothetical protein
MSRIAVLVLAALAGGQEPRKPAASAAIDAGVRNIPGYDTRLQAPPAEDGEFLRRLMLDLVGYPPTADQVKAFAADPDPGKRAARIDELLASEDWADLWSRLFAEVFFGNYHDVPMETRPRISRAGSARMVADFVRWFAAKLRKDAPWTEIVQQMLEARGTDEGDPALAWMLSFYREEGFAVEFANGASRQLLGVRLNCARCHNHPFDQWDVPHYYGLAAFVVRQRARGTGGSAEKDAADHVAVSYAAEGEAVIPDLPIDSDLVRPGKPGAARPLFFYGGEAPPGAGVDRVKVLSSLMTRKENTQLPRALANRVWGWLMGRGVVQPVDDFTVKRNRPISPSLLETLTRTVVDSRYSVKALVRAICNSEAYQRSSRSDAPVKAPDFSRSLIRPLNGEQLVHSLQVATQGKPARNVAQTLQIIQSLFPAGAVWCETTPLPGNARQALLLRNNAEIAGWIASGGVLARIKALPVSLEEKVDEMFLAALSRRPQEAERSRYAGFLRQHPSAGFEDAYWTILNTTEFVTRH